MAAWALCSIGKVPALLSGEVWFLCCQLFDCPVCACAGLSINYVPRSLQSFPMIEGVPPKERLQDGLSSGRLSMERGGLRQKTQKASLFKLVDDVDEYCRHTIIRTTMSETSEMSFTMEDWNVFAHRSKGLVTDMKAESELDRSHRRSRMSGRKLQQQLWFAPRHLFRQ